MELRSLKEKIKEKTGLNDKSLKYIAMALLAVVLLITINSLESKKENGSSESREIITQHNYDDDFREKMTAQLEEIVSEIEGVGKVKIMLTVLGTSTVDYQADIERGGEQEKSKTVIIGNKEALVIGRQNPRIEGVLVVCEGGGSISVREKVINAVSTVLNISANKVYVTNRIKER